MRRLLRVGAIIVLAAVLAWPAGVWAEKKSQPYGDRYGWDDQGDKRAPNEPPGWDQGKKTGWRGEDLPPGQDKKVHRRSKKRYGDDDDWRRRRPYPDAPTVPVPVPVPVPTPR